MLQRPKHLSKQEADNLLHLFLLEAIAWLEFEPVIGSPELLQSLGLMGFRSFAPLDDRTKYYLMMCAFRGSVRGAHFNSALRRCTKRTRREVEKYVREVCAEGAH